MSTGILTETPNTSSMTRELNLGEISFINCLPINYSLKKYLETNEPSFKLRTESGSPTKLNSMLASNLLDLAPISSYEYLRNKNSYQLVDGISISSKKKAESVLLFTRGDINQAKKIYLTNKSASSANLLKIILIKTYNFKNNNGVFYNPQGQELSFENFDTNNLEMDFKLLIGDEALTEDTNNYQSMIDLGEAWNIFSKGLPMVFGLWVLNRQSPWAASYESGREIENFLLKLKDQGLNNYFPDIVIEAYKTTGLKKETIAKYFDSLDYSFNDRHRLSLEMFEKNLVELGLL